MASSSAAKSRHCLHGFWQVQQKPPWMRAPWEVLQHPQLPEASTALPWLLPLPLSRLLHDCLPYMRRPCRSCSTFKMQSSHSYRCVILSQCCNWSCQCLLLHAVTALLRKAVQCKPWHAFILLSVFCRRGSTSPRPSCDSPPPHCNSISMRPQRCHLLLSRR